MAIEVDIGIIGAGPYGLSLAAHLNARRASVLVFGKPMGLWLDHMPKGMHLKSDGFASNLYDPECNFTLRRFCSDQKIKYDDRSIPIPLKVFVDYGCAFQRRFVPNLRENRVVSLRQNRGHYELLLDSDEVIRARQVVVAVGVRCFRYLPKLFEHLGTEFVTHSSDHHALESFSNRDVVVIGAGASAIDIAGLLNETGAEVKLISRNPVIQIHNGGPADHRALWQKIRHPSSGIGPGLRNRFYCEAPWLFHKLPERVRLSIVRRTLGPAAGWFMKGRVIGKLPIFRGFACDAAEIKHGKVHLGLRGIDGSECKLVTDHIISATGYKIDIQRIEFLDPEIRSKIHAVENTPILSSSMESSVPGLYFTGPAAANSFGPVMRFAFGASFATPHLARVLEKNLC